MAGSRYSRATTGRSPGNTLSPGAVAPLGTPVDVAGPCPPAVADPALTGLRHAGIVVSRAQGALGLLPFAVRLPAGGGAESRGATDPV